MEKLKKFVLCGSLLAIAGGVVSCKQDEPATSTKNAVSEKQAINNVRNRIMGNISQYKPVAFGGKWENGYYWKAVSKRGVENDK